MARSALGIGISAIAVLLVGSLTACNNTPPSPSAPQNQAETSGKDPVSITLVSYAVTRDAYEKIIPKFVEAWKAKTGQTVTIEQSYGGSGSQTRAVIDGLDADVVALALGADTEKIEEAGLIAPGWQQENPNDSIVTSSVIALVPRDPNLKIGQWSELATKNLKVITANPKTSGGARWNFLGLWGAVTETGGTAAEAQTFVETVYKNAPVLPKDAREASDVFYQQGQGDLLLNYENEVILAKLNGEEQPYLVPTDYNISITNPVAVVDKNVDKKGTREVAEAFVDYLFTPEAQTFFAESGFRPTDPTVFKKFTDQFPAIKKLSTVEDFGGWKKVQSEFFDDGGVFDKVVAAIKK
ncbi:MAG: sulfate ABC transporter substrate-binding protein [Synechocystis sp.]|jgi:sulfate transport system substrate-binding protein